MIAAYSFFLTACLVLGLSAAGFLSLPFTAAAPSSGALAFPSLFEIRQNAGLLLQGDWNGFGRTLLAYLIFGCMSCLFIVIGNSILHRLFRSKAEEAEPMSSLERLSLSFLSGSLAVSLAWFALGYMRLINIRVAAALLLAGPVLVSLKVYRKVRRQEPLSRMWGTRLLYSWQRLLPAQKALLGALTVLVTLYSTPAFFLTEVMDTLITHLALPGLYINEGRVLIHPSHFHSYLPQNSEMLTLWALLLNSEFAAGLLVWGFFLALMLMVGGFMHRRLGSLVALATVFLLISAPILGYSSTYIKNDMPASAMMVAHYLVLCEAFSPRNRQKRSWVFLAALLCAGAVGHKLILLFALAWSSLAVLAYDFLYTRKEPGRRFLFPFWIAGVALPLAPWFLRTWAATGNPVYPFFHSLFESLGAPSSAYKAMETNYFLFNEKGWEGIRTYLHGLLMVRFDPGSRGSAENVIKVHHVPGWGPSAAFAILLPAIWLKRNFRDLRWPAASAALSLLSLLPWLDLRYHQSLLIFLVSAVFAFGFSLSLNAFPGGLYRAFVIGCVLFCLVQTHSAVHRWAFLKSSLAAVLGGNSPGNYLYTFGLNPEPGKMRWLHHFINTRTDPKETVLFSGVHSVYGIRRKAFFNAVIGEDRFEEWLRASPDAESLESRLLNAGVKNVVVRSHVILNSNFKERAGFHRNRIPGIYIEKADIVGELFNRRMRLRFWTPDRETLWYSLDKDAPPTVLNEEDVRQYPAIFVEEAFQQFKWGRAQTAVGMLELAEKVPMSLENKKLVYEQLISFYGRMGLKDRKERVLKSASELFPEDPASLFNLGVFYEDEGPSHYEEALRQYGRALKIDPHFAPACNQIGNIHLKLNHLAEALSFYEKALSLDPRPYLAYNNIGNVWYSLKDYSKAFQSYRNALEIEPDFAVARENLGNIYWIFGDHGRARQMYKKAAQLRSRESPELSMLGTWQRSTRSDYR